MRSSKLVLAWLALLLAVTSVFPNYAQSATQWPVTATTWLSAVPELMAVLLVVGGAILFSRLGRRNRRHFRR